MTIKNKILIASLFLSSIGFAKSKADSFSCVDMSIGDVMISIEMANGTYALFNYSEGQKTLVDQGLDCNFSNDGAQLFLCSKSLPGKEDFVQYYSETTIVQSMMNSSTSTGFYRQTWESDVRKSKTMMASIYGPAQSQCK